MPVKPSDLSLRANKSPKTTIKFVLTREVKAPSRGHDTDAGIDFYVPKFTKDFIQSFKEKNPLLYNPPSSTGVITLSPSGTISMSNNTTGTISMSNNIDDENDSLIKFDEDEGKAYFPLKPGDRILIPSGVHCKMENTQTALIGANKSGIASKHGLLFGAHVIDYSYQGEIHLNLINTSNQTIRIYEDMKIIQFIETPIYISDIKIYDELEDIYPEETDRGAGGFGSTDHK